MPIIAIGLRRATRENGVVSDLSDEVGQIRLLGGLVGMSLGNRQQVSSLRAIIVFVVAVLTGLPRTILPRASFFRLILLVIRIVFVVKFISVGIVGVRMSL